MIKLQSAKTVGLTVFAAAILIAAAPPQVTGDMATQQVSEQVSEKIDEQTGDTADYAISDVEASFFEGRWAFAEETCDLPTNWTLRADGGFVSEDLTGAWQWAGGRLTLNLVDLAVDEETGEAGGRFQMDGPVQLSGPDGFVFIIEPDRYVLKRCE